MSIAVERADARDPGVQPVPAAERRLSGFDLAILWGDLGIGLLVLVAGALLVPALGLGSALVAIVVGSVIGVALLALGAAAGAQHGIPTMVLLRPVLGIRGSWLPSALNILQLVGWTAVELWAMSFVADLVSQRFFGFSARPLWLALAALICTGFAVWGPIGVTRIWLERFGAWVVAAIVIVVTGLVVAKMDLSAALSAPGAGGLSFGSAVDLVIAMPISWLPLVADYSRFGRGPRSAFSGTFIGYLVANIWLYSLGALLVLGAGAAPTPTDIAAGILSVAGGSLAGVLFLLGLLAGETDEAFANIYSAGVSVQNILPQASRTVVCVAIGGVGTALAAWLSMDRYESFLFLIGSVFVPLFGALVADHFLTRKGLIARDELDRKDGRYWFRGGVRVLAFVPWIAGFAVYHWIAPTGPEWWVDAQSRLWGTPLAARFGWLGASIPAFLVAFAFTLVLRPRRYHPSRPTERSDA